MLKDSLQTKLNLARRGGRAKDYSGRWVDRGAGKDVKAAEVSHASAPGGPLAGAVCERQPHRCIVGHIRPEKPAKVFGVQVDSSCGSRHGEFARMIIHSHHIFGILFFISLPA
jgi:hypothetical protein